MQTTKRSVTEYWMRKIKQLNGRLLREAISERGKNYKPGTVKQKNMAAKIGISPGYWSTIINGHKTPSLTVAQAIELEFPEAKVGQW